MSHTAFPIQRILDRLRVPVTVLAREADVDGSILSKILNARGGVKLSRNYLERLCGHEKLTNEERAALVIGYVEDQIPPDLRPLVLILRARGDEAGNDGGLDGLSLRETPPEETDTLTQALKRLAARARGNPALARALKDIAGVLEGATEPV